MGLIFDTESATAYESWYRSPQGRAIERSLEALIRGLLDPEPGDRVLDIGSGTGNHLLVLSKMGMNVSGIEASPHLIHKAKQRLGHGCTLKEGFAEDLPFDDNEFDMAVLINTLEFLDEPLKALREAGRVASKKVFVGVINSLSWNGLLKRTQGYLGDPLFCHARLYNLWQLRSLLRTAYGPVPISWGCVKVRPPFLEKIRPFGKEVLAWERSPFGIFLGVSATMIYGVRTDNLPLKMRLQKASQPLFGENTLLGLNGKEGD